MPVPIANDAFYIGSRQYKCVGDWLLTSGNIVDTGGEFTYSTANAVKSIPAEALAVDLRVVVSLKGTGVAGTSGGAHIITVGIPGNAGGGAEQNQLGGVEPAGIAVGAEWGSIQLNMTAIITNNIVDPEFTLGLTLTNCVLEKVAVRGYWLP